MSPDIIAPLSGRTCLITGATGFLGRHLVRRLRESGIDAVLMLRRGQRPPPHARAVHAALDDSESLIRAVEETAPDVVFHLAARTDPSRDIALTDVMMRENLGATLTLAQAAQRAGVSRFVFTGTCEEYGLQSPPFREDMPPSPLSPYSASKAAASTWLRMFHETEGFPVVILRPFLVYGPGQSPPKLVPTACAAALEGRDFAMTSGKQFRELTYVEDAIDAMLRASVVPKAIGQIINVGSGSEHRVIDLVRQIYSLADSGGQPRPGALPDRPNEMQHFCADPARARDLLGWEATTPLETGLAQTLGWMRENGEVPIPL